MVRALCRRFCRGPRKWRRIRNLVLRGGVTYCLPKRSTESYSARRMGAGAQPLYRIGRIKPRADPLPHVAVRSPHSACARMPPTAVRRVVVTPPRRSLRAQRRRRFRGTMPTASSSSRAFKLSRPQGFILKPLWRSGADGTMGKSWQQGTRSTRRISHRQHTGRVKGCLAQIQHKTKSPLFQFPANCSKQRHATLAQLVERLIRNQQVASSILAGGSS
jgi:hypothetical protein